MSTKQALAILANDNLVNRMSDEAIAALMRQAGLVESSESSAPSTNGKTFTPPAPELTGPEAVYGEYVKPYEKFLALHPVTRKGQAKGEASIHAKLNLAVVTGTCLTRSDMALIKSDSLKGRKTDGFLSKNGLTMTESKAGLVITNRMKADGTPDRRASAFFQAGGKVTINAKGEVKIGKPRGFQFDEAAVSAIKELVG